MAVCASDGLVASHFTLTGAVRGEPPRTRLEERIGAAAAAGFDGIGIRVDDYLAERDRGLTSNALVAALDRHGLAAPELEALYGWAEDEPGSAAPSGLERDAFELAEIVGARHVTACDIAEVARPLAPERSAARFAALCDRAADHGLLVGLEFLPWSRIDRATTAWEVVRLAGRPNGGLVIDSWHQFRGTGSLRDLARIPPEGIVAVQINDGALERVGPWLDDTTRRRRLPGHGSFDLVGFLRTLDGMGVAVPLSVEVLSEELYRLPVDSAAAAAAVATREVLRRAGVPRG